MRLVVERKCEFAALFAFGAAIFLVDIALKHFMVTVVMDPPRIIPVTPFFNLVLVYNPGVSFGMFAEWISAAPQLFAVLKACIVAGLLSWAAFSRRMAERLALCMVAGGAMGNLVDRYADGHVTDYLDFYAGQWHWPSFNLADVAIVAGAGFMIVVASFQRDTATSQSS